MSSSSVTAAEEQRLLSKGVPRDKVDEYAAAFALFAVPVGAQHRITLESLRAMLAKFGQEFVDADLKYMLRQFSPRGGGGAADEGEGVDFETFATSMHEKMADARFNEAFGDAFDLFDQNKSGELTKAELMQGMMMLGETLTEAEADEMIKVAKKKDDFVRAMSQSLAGGSGSGGGGGGGGGAAAAAPAPAAAATPSTPSAAAAAPSGPARPPGPGGGGPPRPGGAPAAPSGPGTPGPPRPGGPPRPAGAPAAPAGAPRPPGAPGSPRPPRPS